MKTSLSFSVTGDPKPQPRTRSYMTKDGRSGVYNPSSAGTWRLSLVAAVRHMREVEARRGLDVSVFPLKCPVEMELNFYVARPKRLMRKKDPAGYVPCTTAFDLDNASKLVMDVLQQEGVLKDDKVVYVLNADKHYVPKGDCGATGGPVVPGLHVVLAW